MGRGNNARQVRDNGTRYVHGRARVPLPAAADDHHARVRLVLSYVAWPFAPSGGQRATLNPYGSFSPRGADFARPPNKETYWLQAAAAAAAILWKVELATS